MAAQLTIAVIGAGYAGCAAAITAQKLGAQVTILERARTAGGRARRVAIAPFGTLDNGQHILAGAYRELLGLMQAVGVDCDAAFDRRALELHVLPHFHLRAPLRGRLGNALALASARGLNWPARWRAVMLVQSLRRARYRLREDQPLGRWLAGERQPAALIRYLWEPLAVAALNTPLHAASAQLFANVLRDTIDGPAGASDLLLPRVDLSTLFPDPALAHLAAHGATVAIGRAVRALGRAEDGTWRLDDDPLPYDAVILAAAPTDAARLLEGLPETAAVGAQLAALDYEPIYTVYLQFPAQVRLPQSMIGFAPSGGSLVQWAFDRGNGVIAAVISARGRHEEYPLDALGERVAGELRNAFPVLPAATAVRTIAEQRATFSARPGLVRPGNATALAGLCLAGDYTASDYPGTLESAVRSGQAAAHLACAVRR